MVTFTTADAPQRVLDFYHDRAARSGYSAEHQCAASDHVLGGANERDGGAFYLIVTPLPSGGSDVALIANNGGSSPHPSLRQADRRSWRTSRAATSPAMPNSSSSCSAAPPARPSLRGRPAEPAIRAGLPWGPDRQSARRLLIGLLAGCFGAARSGRLDAARVGLLGGFTTFSAFSFDCSRCSARPARTALLYAWLGDRILLLYAGLAGESAA